jgi:2'-5' RNA ligase
MGFESNGRPRAIPAEARPNVFALVIYIPEPLGQFLDNLRRELVPGCNPHAHVSVLPPRSLAVDWHSASEEARILAEGWTPFDVELTSVEIFPMTQVIYLEVGAGASELRNMHDAMNTRTLEFTEPYPYQPHITLAQEIDPKEVAHLHELAVRRWQEFRGPRSFHAERAVFVQNPRDNIWVDLASYALGAVAVR